MPNWFLHNETNSLIITIKFSAWRSLKYRFMGFAFCLVLGASESNRKNNRPTGLMVGCRYYFGDKYEGTSMIKSSCSDAESDQVWLWYDQILDVADVSRKLPSEVSFEFFVRPGSSGSMVKQCGIRPLYTPFDIMQSSNEEVSREGKMLTMSLNTKKIQEITGFFATMLILLMALDLHQNNKGFLGVMMDILWNPFHLVIVPRMFVIFKWNTIMLKYLLILVLLVVVTNHVTCSV